LVEKIIVETNEGWGKWRAKKLRKIGCNEPCPCGSGKKYKRCHGGGGKGGDRAVSEIPLAAKNVSVKFTGLAAQAEHLHIINRFKGDDPRNRVPIKGTEGDYKVIFVLARPGFNLLPEGNCSLANGLRGDSHLAMAKPAFAPPGNPDADQISLHGLSE
jgi:SEC-C motif